jgi:hypothetical protein
MNQYDEEILPAPIIDDGLQHSFEVIDGDVWEKADSNQPYADFIHNKLLRM